MKFTRNIYKPTHTHAKLSVTETAIINFNSNFSTSFSIWIYKMIRAGFANSLRCLYFGPKNIESHLKENHKYGGNNKTRLENDRYQNDALNEEIICILFPLDRDSVCVAHFAVCMAWNVSHSVVVLCSSLLSCLRYFSLHYVCASVQYMFRPVSTISDEKYVDDRASEAQNKISGVHFLTIEMYDMHRIQSNVTRSHGCVVLLLHSLIHSVQVIWWVRIDTVYHSWYHSWCSKTFK